MTYRELLFKMADSGMLTLSNDKDGRGLFWAGMNNMEALENEFNLKVESIINLDSLITFVKNDSSFNAHIDSLNKYRETWGA